MARIHKATWHGDPPQRREADARPLDPGLKSSGPRMAEALSRLAAAGGPGIEDPAAWERCVREDRSLPGRDD